VAANLNDTSCSVTCGMVRMSPNSAATKAQPSANGATSPSVGTVAR